MINLMRVIILVQLVFTSCILASTKNGVKSDLASLIKCASKRAASLPVNNNGNPKVAVAYSKTLLTSIQSTICYRIKIFLQYFGIKSLNTNREMDRLKAAEADKFFKHMWQAFLPGCVTEEARVDTNRAIQIVEVTCSTWKPLEPGQILFWYRFSGETQHHGYPFEPPKKSRLSFLTNPIVTESLFGRLDTPICLLHIYDCVPYLNYELINEINKGTVLRTKDNTISVKHRQSMKSAEIHKLKNLVETTPLPVEFSREDIDKKLRAGFLPRMENYYNLSDQSFRLLVRNILRCVIGKHAGLSFTENFNEERAELVDLLHTYFSSFLPGSKVYDVLQPVYDPIPEQMIHVDTSDEIVLYNEVQYSIILELPCIEQRKKNISIKQHVSIQHLILPNVIAFKERRYSAFSSLVYNSTGNVIELKEYRPLIRTAMSKIALALSSEEDGKHLSTNFDDLKTPEIVLESHIWPIVPSLVVMPLVYIDDGTILGYDQDIIYIAKRPMILQFLKDKYLRSIVAKHVDEPILTMDRIIITKPHN